MNKMKLKERILYLLYKYDQIQDHASCSKCNEKQTFIDDYFLVPEIC
ncbi:MAG: hypothetical protein AB1668_04005 [Nanoarchaeota archaeon]